MSIGTDVARIKGNITAALAAIADKGVTVPDGSTSDALAGLIASIESGDAEIYIGSVTMANDSYSIGVEVYDSSAHTNKEIPRFALFANTTNFSPGAYVTVIGVVNGVAFRHVGVVPTIGNGYEEYVRGVAPTDEELAVSICKFYGSKTWFYSHSLNIPLGSNTNVTNTKLFKAGDTYHYYIVY